MAPYAQLRAQRSSCHTTARTSRGPDFIHRRRSSQPGLDVHSAVDDPGFALVLLYHGMPEHLRSSRTCTARSASLFSVDSSSAPCGPELYPIRASKPRRLSEASPSVHCHPVCTKIAAMTSLEEAGNTNTYRRSRLSRPGAVNGAKVLHALSEMGSGGLGGTQQTVDNMACQAKMHGLCLCVSDYESHSTFSLRSII